LARHQHEAIATDHGGDVRKRSVVVAGHRTSVSLEAEFWSELKAIAAERKQSINELVETVDRGRAGNLSSALRLFVLAELRRRAEAATPPGETSASQEPTPEHSGGEKVAD
jgi:predicted DNA-binding ribbon-helix-helix protein